MEKNRLCTAYIHGFEDASELLKSMIYSADSLAAAKAKVDEVIGAAKILKLDKIRELILLL